MSDAEVALEFYKTARAELIERIKLRDAALFLYIAAAATIFAAVLSGKASRATLVVVPFVALGATIVIAQHHQVIGDLGLYCGKELDYFLVRGRRDGEK